jgi:hypothetical protein
MWKWRNGLRPRTLVLCALCAMLGIVGGPDLAPAAREAAEPAPLRVHASDVDGPHALAKSGRRPRASS